MRRHDDPIQVRLGRENDPVQFIWRDRLWRVLAVEVHWIESGAWWTGPAVRAARGQDSGEQGATWSSATTSPDRYRFDDTLLRDSATGGRSTGSAAPQGSPSGRTTAPAPAREWPGEGGATPDPAGVRGAAPTRSGDRGTASVPAGERSTVSAHPGGGAGSTRAGERGADPARAGERTTHPASAGEWGTVSASAGEWGTASASAGERTTHPAPAGEWGTVSTPAGDRGNPAPTSRASVGASEASLRELGEDPDLLCETEVWRVEAANGMAGSRGIYELAHLVHSGQWQLRGVMD